MSVQEKLTAIADTIRAKTGSADKLDLDGLASGVEEVFAAGKQNECKQFWDVYQESGVRTNYGYSFARWSKEAFKPKYDMQPTDATYMFAYFADELDLVELLS